MKFPWYYTPFPVTLKLAYMSDCHRKLTDEREMAVSFTYHLKAGSPIYTSYGCNHSLGRFPVFA